MNSVSRLADLLDGLCRTSSVPGIAVGVIHEGGLTTATSGVTDLATGTPVDADTLFMIGSVTKLVTATAAMTLVQSQALCLDDLVVDYLPELELADHQARATLRVWHLFSHVAGWSGDLFGDTGWGEDALARAVAELLPRAPQIATPGTLAFYNNAALMLAGRLIERVTGRSYEEFVTTEILLPIGMDSACFQPWQVANQLHAVGHRRTTDGQEPFRPWPLPRCFAPTGGLHCSVSDLVAFARFQLDGSATRSAPLHPSTRLDMRRRRATLEGDLGVGIGWMLRPYGDLAVYGHGGNVSGIQIADLAIAPEQGFAVVVLTNGPDGVQAGEQIFDWCVAHYLRRPRPQPIPPAVTATADYVGRYEAGGWCLAVEDAGDGCLRVALLILDAEGRVVDSDPSVIVHIGVGEVLSTAERPWAPVGQFVREGGEGTPVTGLRWHMRLARRVSADG